MLSRGGSLSRIVTGPTGEYWLYKSGGGGGGSAHLPPAGPLERKREVYVPPLAGLMFFWRRYSSVTVLDSQYERHTLLSCCFSICTGAT